MRGSTGRKSIGLVTKINVLLEHNSYYNSIINCIDEGTKNKCSGINCLISIDNLHTVSEELLCKSCVKDAIIREHEKTIEITSEHIQKSKYVNDIEGLIHLLSTVHNNGTRQTNKILDTSQIPCSCGRSEGGKNILKKGDEVY